MLRTIAAVDPPVAAGATVLRVPRAPVLLILFIARRDPHALVWQVLSSHLNALGASALAARDYPKAVHLLTSALV